jgi:integrase/recombinase XerC
VLYASGCRRAEIATLDLHDVDLDRRIMRVIGKGDKQRTVLINEAASERSGSPSQTCAPLRADEKSPRFDPK